MSNEMRFSQMPEPEEPTIGPMPAPVITDLPKKKKKPAFLKIAIAVIVAAAVFGVYKIIAWQFFSPYISDSYYAVFLDNNQVYFGKMASKSKEEVILQNVYYLQTGASPSTEASFSLVKMGNELHAPKDEMYINMSHIVFYEELRDDSKVVQSIKNQ